MVDSHTSLQNSKSIAGKVKTHEVLAVATSLQLFNKVDLQVMKAGRRPSGGTFMPFYLRDLCPQADSLLFTDSLQYILLARGSVGPSLSFVFPFFKKGGPMRPALASDR